jgi:hypothetical protein
MSHPTLRLFDGYDHTSPELRGEVEGLQRSLNQKGYNIPVDGYFGPGTEAAVKDFQKKQNLDDDGIVGPFTWAALLGAPVPPFSTSEITTFPLNSPSLLADLQEAAQYKAVVDQAAAQFDLQKAMIGGLASRESRWGLALTPRGPAGTGDKVPRALNLSLRPGPLPSDGGFGRGLMQIDYDAFPFARTGNWQDPRENVLFGCKVLSDYRQLIQSKTHLEGRPLLQATVAAYNCGPGRVLTALQKQMDVDFYTAGRNYSRDVLNRTGWFQLQGWV